MKNQMIAIKYLDGIIDDETIERIKVESNFDIKLLPSKPVIMNSIMDLLTTIVILIPKDIVNSLTKNIIDEAIKDAVKNIATLIKKGIEGKKINKIENKKWKEESPTISIKTKNIEIYLPQDVSEEKFKYCIDAAFKDIERNRKIVMEKNTVTVYEPKKDSMITYEKNQYIYEKYGKQGIRRTMNKRK